MTSGEQTHPGPTPVRSVFVTGGTRGIGLATARAFARAGHRVAVGSRSGTLAAEVAESLLVVPCDVTDGASVDAAFATVEAEHGAVEVLVANAGITRDTLLVRMTDEDFAAVLDTNLTGAFRVARRAVKAMMRARYGRMIFVSSVVALMGSSGQVNYAASKAGLIGLARSIAREYGSRGITANVVAPGLIETDMTAGLEEGWVAAIMSGVPLNRLGRPEEVADLIAWLGSDASSYVSGAVIPITGAGGTGF